jgi:hypothetical protein
VLGGTNNDNPDNVLDLTATELGYPKVKNRLQRSLQKKAKNQKTKNLILKSKLLSNL